MSSSSKDGLGIKIGIRNGKITLALTEPIKWLSLTPEDADELARSLQKFAAEVRKRKVQ